MGTGALSFVSPEPGIELATSTCFVNEWIKFCHKSLHGGSGVWGVAPGSKRRGFRVQEEALGVRRGSQVNRHRPPRHLQWGGQDPAPARAHAGACVGGVGTRAPGARRGARGPRVRP